MIIDSIDFSDLFDSIQASFAANIEKGRLNKIQKQLTQNVKLLADANLKCYHYNMRTIAERKKIPVDHRLISDMDLEVRIVNECRVKARARINSLLSSVYPPTEDKNVTSESWMTDDIVYSVGDMIDRLIIERIKVEDYEARQGRAGQVRQMRQKTRQSHMWSERVKRCLDLKLQEIAHKGSYECIDETRTYDFSGVKRRVFSTS